MPYRTFALLAALALALCVSVPANAGKMEADEAFGEFERLLPLAGDSENEKSAAEVRKALDSSSPWQAIAAVEAVRQADVDKGSGKVFLPDILKLLAKEKEKLHKDNEIVAVNIFACLYKLVNKEDPDMMETVKALIAWQRWSDNQIVRLRHMAERLLFKLTDQDCTFKTETLTFWDWWVFSKSNNQDTDKPPEKKSKTAPVLFKEPMVGTRVVFVIDVSDSMKWEITETELPALKKKLSHLPWDKMPVRPSPMDVAKAELAFSIDKLRPQADEPQGPKKGSSSKKNTEARQFAIITYSDDAKFFTETGWIEASEANCNAWMTSVENLATQNRTNIHGGLVLAFGLSEKRLETMDPEVDKDCVLTGAHTIVFLTDGYPTWSNDSTAYDAKDPEFNNPCGNGEYVKRDKLIELANHLNRFRKVLINTVGIGNHDKKLMAAFAKNSGGNYQDWYCRIDSPR